MFFFLLVVGTFHSPSDIGQKKTKKKREREKVNVNEQTNKNKCGMQKSILSH